MQSATDRFGKKGFTESWTEGVCVVIDVLPGESSPAKAQAGHPRLLSSGREAERGRTTNLFLLVDVLSAPQDELSHYALNNGFRLPLVVQDEVSRVCEGW